jgi:hypothetical protein
LHENRIKPEEKVNLAINMTDVCVRICADAIIDRCPAISEEELIERIRERITYMKKLEREV